MSRYPDTPEAETGRAVPWGYVVAGVAVAFLLVFLLTLRGRPSASRIDEHSPKVEVQRDELFDYAINSLNRQEEFDTGEMLKQAVDRLDRWVENQDPPADWQPDPMLSTLPEPLAALPVLADPEKLQFLLGHPAWDGQALQEAVWLRDLSNWARGEQVDDVARAEQLFDWVVRNIQLDRLPPSEGEGAVARAIQRPWETLLLGHGSARERAWVFILLLRQQGLDAAMIGPAAADTDQRPVEKQEEEARLVGVLSGKEIFLFDAELGLPVPAPQGPDLDADGRLVVHAATLAQVVSDDGLLRRLDADADHPYPLRSEQLKAATVLLEASPSHLTWRMRLVEARLAGDDKMVLCAAPSEQAERFKGCEHVGQVRLWTLPYQSALQEEEHEREREQWRSLALMPFFVGVETPGALWKGRAYHLKGKLEGSPSAIEFYQMARPSNRMLGASDLNDQMKRVFLLAKLNASYWLGLVSAYQGNDREAIDYLNTRTLQLTASSPWLHGAVYNLSRIFEAAEVERAIALYKSDDQSPAYHGNLLRAGWLESLRGVKVDWPARDRPVEKDEPGTLDEPGQEKPAGEAPQAVVDPEKPAPKAEDSAAEADEPPADESPEPAAEQAK